MQEVYEEYLERRDGACCAGEQFKSVSDSIRSPPYFTVTINKKCLFRPIDSAVRGVWYVLRLSHL